MKAIKLRVEYLKEPIALGKEKPRFFWQCEGDVSQKAYQITVTRQSETVFDSGKVISSKNTHIFYEGKKLNSRDELKWTVQLWNEKDEPGEISESFFEMGLLKQSDFVGKWISGNYKPKKNERYPADYFCRAFELKKNIRKARLYLTARGIYDVCVNGKRIEEFILAPGITDYRKRIQVQCYDVTALLKEQNTLELRLADGWYRGSCAAYGVVNVYGTQTSIMGQLEVTYEDGSTFVLPTDDSFLWSNDGPIRFADLKDGEIFDASKRPSYNGKAVMVEAPKAKLIFSGNEYVKEHEVFNGKLIEKDGIRVIDFSQNIAGILSFKVKGKRGQTVKLVLGEILSADGHVDLSGIQETRPFKGWNNISLITKLMTNKVNGETDYTPHQSITFICSGNEDEYKTSFAVFGFRYAEIIGDIEINEEDFQAIAVYTDMKQTGSFACSNGKINQMFENTLWSMKGNFLDIPTDCPTRERLGWTGDAQIFFETGAYMMDTAAFFRKWMKDMEDAQYKDGLLPAVLPYEGVEMMYKSTGSSVGWADAVYLIPYRFYKMYGDEEILKECWPMIRKYAEHLINNRGFSKKKGRKNPYNEYVYEKGVHLGEWLEPEEFRDKVYGAKEKHPEECTAYMFLAFMTIAEIAALVKEDEYAQKLRELAEKAREAYNVCFAEFDTMRQAKLVRPLALGLYDGERKKLAQRNLKQALEEYHYRVGTGFLSTPFILPVLNEAGFIDTAYKVLLNEEKPGWLAEVNDGASTIWENWEGNLSQNHYSPGSVCQWLFDGICGIKLNGRNRFVIRPVVGDQLDHARAEYDSLYGRISSGWSKKGDKTIYEITVPVNCEADICLPDNKTRHVKTGVYRYEI